MEPNTIQAVIDDPFQIPLRLWILITISCVIAGVASYAIRKRTAILESRRFDYLDFAIELVVAVFVGNLVALVFASYGYSALAMLIAGTVGAYLNRTSISIATKYIPYFLEEKLGMKVSEIRDNQDNGTEGKKK